jgi:hypothetical protein
METRGSVIRMFVSVKHNTWQEKLLDILELCDTVLDETKINSYIIIYIFWSISQYTW